MENEILFSPFKLNGFTLKNRIGVAPMTRTSSPGDSIPRQDVLDFLVRRAQNGAAIVYTEAIVTDYESAQGYPKQARLTTQRQIDAWKSVVQAIQQEGAVAVMQMFHCGRMSSPEVNPAGRVIAPSAITPKQDNPITGSPYVLPDAMTQFDIDHVIKGFVETARGAVEAGFDGIEIHGAHGYLVDQFFWEGTNQRDDSYGGSLVDRTRFGVEIVEACRAAVGPDFPIILRFSQWKQQDYAARLAQTPEELEAFLTPLSEAGVDIFHCSQRRFWEPEFEGSNLNLAGWVRKITGKPAITVGSVGLDADFIPETPEDAFREAQTASLDDLLARMENDEFELVAVGRALIANPEWANLVRENRSPELQPFAKEMLATLV